MKSPARPASRQHGAGRPATFPFTRGRLARPTKGCRPAMATAPSVSYSMTVRLEVPASGTAVSQLTTA
ncbi:hypothetical protein, partial [Streptomyces netropsis]|uniref:hypothetical protein n=1 Tax=Streptomyces netropsis TaxID=55404 RepID=UPI0035D7C65E